MDLSTAQTLLSAAQDAYTKALAAQAVAIGDRSISRQRIIDARQELLFWTRTVEEITSSQAGSTRPGTVRLRWS